MVRKAEDLCRFQAPRLRSLPSANYGFESVVISSAGSKISYSLLQVLINCVKMALKLVKRQRMGRLALACASKRERDGGIRSRAALGLLPGAAA